MIGNGAVSLSEHFRMYYDEYLRCLVEETITKKYYPASLFAYDQDFEEDGVGFGLE